MHITFSALLLLLITLVVFALAILIWLLTHPSQKQVPSQGSEDAQQLSTVALHLEKTVYSLYGYSHADHDEQRDTVTILTGLDDVIQRERNKQNALKQVSSQSKEIPSRHTAIAPLLEPSPLAKEIIRIRDEMLLALPKEGDMLLSAEVLNSFYQELGIVLEQDDVTSLETVGNTFDEQRQRIIDTYATNDQRQDTVVAQSTSPGYLFQERLLRPQGVIIYKFKAV